MTSRRQQPAPPSALRWIALSAVDRELVIDHLADLAQVRERLAEEQPDDARIYIDMAAPFRAAIEVLESVIEHERNRGRRGR